jgi:SOUL heme-binding protein
MTEELPFRVVQNYANFQIRKYESYVLVQYSGEGEFSSVSSQAFRPLFQFISGDNSTQQKIAMTAPVLQEESTSGQHLVSFVMPSSMTIDDVPAAIRADLSIQEVPAHFAAAIRFSGGWNEGKFLKKCARLKSDLANEGIATEGDCFFARFDPPWKPGFLRRNEVLIRVAGASIESNGSDV